MSMCLLPLKIIMLHIVQNPFLPALTLTHRIESVLLFEPNYLESVFFEPTLFLASAETL